MTWVDLYFQNVTLAAMGNGVRALGEVNGRPEALLAVPSPKAGKVGT